MNSGDNRFTRTFPAPKPILGMLHLTGASRADRLQLAQQETETLIRGGVDGIIVENYFGTKDDVRNVLEWLEVRQPELTVGVNVLRDHRLAFSLSNQFKIDFIQMDSVAGHLPPEEDEEFAEELAELRNLSDALLLGGVRFKYQLVKSGRSEAEDLSIGSQRCDAFVVTSEATGEETDLAKVKRFRSVTGADFPLLIGAGMTSTNAGGQLELADGAIVGSFFKDTHRDTGMVEARHVEQLMAVVKAKRAGLPMTGLAEGAIR